MADQENLFLGNQLCFPIYATSRLITRKYKPYLDEIGLTYPQYLVLLVLWEKDTQKVSAIGDKLLLNTNTITPLLLKLKEKGLIQKTRSLSDDRVKMIRLTEKGKKLKAKASEIPEKMAGSSNIPLKEMELIRKKMWEMLNFLES